MHHDHRCRVARQRVEVLSECSAGTWTFAPTSQARWLHTFKAASFGAGVRWRW